MNLFTAQSTERSLRSLNRFILGCGLLFAAAATLGWLGGGGYLSPVLFLWFTVGLRYALRDWTHPLWIGLQGWALVYIDGPCLWYAVAGKTINAAEGLPIDPVFMTEGGLLQALLMLAIFYLALASLALRKVQPVHFPARNFVLEDKTFYRLAVVLIGLLGLGFMREIQFAGSSLERAPGLVNELIRFLFHDAAIFFALSLFNLGRLNGKNSQSVGWVQAGLLVLCGGFFTAAGSKGAILVGLFLVVLWPAACASFLGFQKMLLPPFALLAAAVGLSPCLFMVGLAARLTIHQNSAVAGDWTGAWGQTLDSLGQVPDFMDTIFYRISAEVNRYFLLVADFFQNDEAFRRLEYGSYIGKNLVNLFFPGTPFPEAYFMSSMFLPQLLDRSELISGGQQELVLQMNTQPLTLFGLLLFFFGYAAPAVFLLYALLTQKVLFGRFPLVATGAFLFFFFSFSMYGLEAVAQRAAMFTVNLFIFLHLARWLCGKRPKLLQAQKSLEP